MKGHIKTVEFSSNVRNVFLHITTRCNLRCLHCYINKNEHGLRDLTKEEIGNYLEIFSPSRKILPDINISSCNLIILGGEPTLSPNLSFTIETARKLGYTSITIDSNGIFPDIIFESLNSSLVDNVCISLDSPVREVNDRIRGEGVFDRATKSIEKLIHKGFKVSVIFTASMLNINTLPEMPLLLDHLGVRRFFIQIIGLRGRAMDGHGLQVPIDVWQGTLEKTLGECLKRGIHVTYPKVYLGLHEEFRCAGLVSENFFVFPNGRVYTCPLCEDYPLHRFEIIDGELKERPKITERDLYSLRIDEGCVMNKILHPHNIPYDSSGRLTHRIACCMLKEELIP